MSDVRAFTVDLNDPLDVRNKHQILKERLRELEHQCVHVCVASNPKEPECSHPVCKKCGQQIDGWFCPASLDGQCDYKQSDGTYNDDHCIHCGDPDERK